MAFRKRNHLGPFQECPVSQSLTFGTGRPPPPAARPPRRAPAWVRREPSPPSPLRTDTQTEGACVCWLAVLPAPAPAGMCLEILIRKKTALETDGNWAPGDGLRPTQCHEANNVIDAVYGHGSVTDSSRRARRTDPWKPRPDARFPAPPGRASAAQGTGRGRSWRRLVTLCGFHARCSGLASPRHVTRAEACCATSL